MDKLKMQSVDGVARNIDKILELFPNAETEILQDGKPTRAVDFDVLKQELAYSIIEGPEERYQFTWPDKRETMLKANLPIPAALRPVYNDVECDGKKIRGSVGRDGTIGGFDSENLYIEGDNLEVLKILREAYLRKVKMIYIDPPYNTGEDFIYNDDFAQDVREYMANSGQYDEQGNRMEVNPESNGRFHTDWLNMIYPRLKIAKDLLADDGVILINMDEHEIINLSKICVEIFGQQNDLGIIVWDKRNPKGDAHAIAYQHEYIVAFAKNIAVLSEVCEIKRPKKNAQQILDKAKQFFNQISQSYTLEDANREFAAWLRRQDQFSGGERAYNKIDENGKVFRPVSMAWPNRRQAPDDYFVPLIHPITKKPCPVPARGWRNPSSTMKKMLSEGRILFGIDESTIPNSKYLLEENMYENIPSLIYYGGSDIDMLENMGIPFDTPKVVNICKEHIQAFTKDNDIILDFFSGSATTAHAVMQLNAEDDGKRKFIMVQIPEICKENSDEFKAGYENICEIGKERIRRAGKKIKEENPLTTQDLDVGFRCLRLDTSNMKDVYYRPEKLRQSDLFAAVDNVKEDRSPEDLLFQVMPELCADFSSKIEEKKFGG